MAAVLTPAQREWLTDLYEAHAPMVFHLCRRILNNPDEAADATHEIFIKAAQSLEMPPAEKMRPWLLTVTRNYCFDLLRRQKRAHRALAALGIQPWSASIDPEGVVVQRDVVETVLNQLSVRERTALWQSAVERLGLADIARGLNLNYMAAGQVVSRARKHAALVAAAVAAFMVWLRPDRIARRLSVVSAKLVAATALPIVALTVQPSSSTTPGHPSPVVHATSPATLARSVPAPSGRESQATGEATSQARSIRIPAVPTPSDVGGLVRNATGSLPQLIPIPLTPAPLPSLVPAPSLPSLPLLPTPPPLP
jgi:RNA polymerase sigma-70 factor (ECF subfamily)